MTSLTRPGHGPPGRAAPRSSWRHPRRRPAPGRGSRGACGVDPGGDQRGGVDHPTLLPELDAQGVQPSGAASRGRLGQAATSASSSPPTRETWDLDRLVMPLAWAMSPPGGWRHPRPSPGPRPRPTPARPARPQEAGQVAALADPRELQLDGADPRVPIPGPVAVAVGGPLRAALAVLSAELGAHLGIHQRLGKHPHALAQEVDIAAVRLAQQLQQLQGGHGHRDRPLDVVIRPFTSRT
jgi:hypothetical protein